MSEGELDSHGGDTMGENFVDFKCPYCNEGISFPEPRKGLLEECPICMESVVVPDDGSETGGRVPFPITTERLVLRRFERGDWKGALEMFNDPGATRLRHTIGRRRIREGSLRLLRQDRCGTRRKTCRRRFHRVAME